MMKLPMKSALTLLTGWLVLSACGAETSETSSSGLDIVGGSVVSGETYTQHFQSTVSLQYGSQDFCGGTLISENQVLTAAHCMKQFGAGNSNLRVVVGTSNIRDTRSAEVFKVSAINVHPSYVTNNTNYDIAMVTLSGNSKFKPAKLNKDASFPAVGQTSYVAGWGATSEGGASSQALKATGVQIISNEQCSKVYGSKIYDGSLCAYAQGTDSCQGDSGGPLYAFSEQENSLVLVGVVSFGKGCARQGYPGVYTRVSTFFNN